MRRGRVIGRYLRKRAAARPAGGGTRGQCRTRRPTAGVGWRVSVGVVGRPAGLVSSTSSSAWSPAPAPAAAPTAPPTTAPGGPRPRHRRAAPAAAPPRAPVPAPGLVVAFGRLTGDGTTDGADRATDDGAGGSADGHADGRAAEGAGPGADGLGQPSWSSSSTAAPILPSMASRRGWGRAWSTSSSMVRSSVLVHR